MLAELFDKFVNQIAKNTRDKIRVLNVPSAPPGVINYLVEGEDGVVTKSEVVIALRAPIYTAMTMVSFKTTIELHMNHKDDEADQVHLFIAPDKLSAFIIEAGNFYEDCERVELALTETDAWKYACSSHISPSLNMKCDIRRLFTGTDKAFNQVGVTNIMDLIPLLSKVSVKEAKNSRATNTKSNNTLGVEIDQELIMDGTDDIPEVVRVPVQQYKQVDHMTYVDMLFRYDFEESKFVLTPIQPSVQAACDSTTNQIQKLLNDISVAEGKFTVFPAAINFADGKVTLA